MHVRQARKICCTHAGTTHEQHSVFSTVQNLVRISSVVLKIFYADCNVMQVWLENAYSHPLWGVFGVKWQRAERFLQLYPSRGIEVV